MSPRYIIIKEPRRNKAAQQPQPDGDMSPAMEMQTEWSGGVAEHMSEPRMAHMMEQPIAAQDESMSGPEAPSMG